MAGPHAPNTPRIRARRVRRTFIAAALCCAAVAPAAWGRQARLDPPPAVITDSPYEGVIVSAVRLEGLAHTSEQLVSNQLRTREGAPYSDAIARDDVRRLYRLGRFRVVDAALEVADDGRLTVVFRFVEAPIVQDVQVVGNRQISDQDLARIINILPGIPVDEYQVGRSIRAIEEMYRNRGFYLVDVTLDERELEEHGIVLFRVREGERIRVTDIRFSGNASFRDTQIRQRVNTKTSGIFERGPLDNDVLDRDVNAIIRFYREHGYLDVRADRQITPSPNGREAIVTFIIDEGPVYTLRNVNLQVGAVEGRDPVYTPTQLIAIMEIKPGEVYSTLRIDRSVDGIRAAYWRLGFADVRITREELRDPDAPEAGVVDLYLVIVEGDRYRTGEVIIQGNTITKQKVIRRHVRVQPDRPLDMGAIRDTERRLELTRLFEAGSVRTTVQPVQPEYPGYRDVLVEVAETDTGAISFGAAVGSDSGLTGLVSLEQRNFDVLDPPESFDELIRGQAFRGAGQYFNIAIQPGTEVQTYTLTLTEPHLFETDYSLTGQAFYRDRIYNQYDEQRYGGRARLGRRFGDRWNASLNIRADWVELSDIDSRAPADIFEVADLSLITGVGIDLIRTTVPPAQRFRPTRGTRLELGVERVGALGGDYDFTKLSAEHQIFMTVYEDYLGRKGVLTFRTRAAYIPEKNESPIYERYFLGGRSFRGFDFRTVSPRGFRLDGTPSNEPIGGDWMFFFGTEYEHPVWQELVTVVFFMDSGTVTEEIGFDQYRVSLGVGIRLYIPQLGQAPLAFDFGFPIKKEPGDDERLFSFALDIPF